MYKKMTEITSASAFDEAIEATKTTPVFLKIHSTGCGYCIDLIKPWKELSKHTKTKLLSVDENARKDIMDKKSKYANMMNIGGYPTLVWVSNAKIAATFPGNQERNVENMVKFIEEQEAKTKRKMEGGSRRSNKSVGFKIKRKSTKTTKNRNKKTRTTKRTKTTRRYKRRTH